MGVTCKIHKRKDGTVEMVEAPNGEASTLYQKALERVGNVQEALKLWTVPYTIGFKSINGNWEKQGTSTTNSVTLKSKKGFNEGVDYVARVAQAYKKQIKNRDRSHLPVTRLNKKLSAEMARQYENTDSSSTSPEVKESYERMIEETLLQYDFIIQDGLKVVKHEGIGEPYANSREMLEDLRENKTLKFLPNEVAFGQDTDVTKVDNIGLRKSGRSMTDGYELTNSEVFRIVHDYFGHGILGNQFGAIGEENATLQHLDLFSEKAAPAVIFQTRGQNSWVNFSGVNKQASELRKEAKLLREVGNFSKAKQKLKQAEELFKFADPKINIFPHKYNFRKYDTARRIQESEEIDRLNLRTVAQDNELPKLLSNYVSRGSTKRGVNRSDRRGTRKRLGSFDVEVINEYNLDEGNLTDIQAAFPRFKGLQTMYEINDGATYREMMKQVMEDHPFSSAVTLHSAEEFSKMRMFVTEDGSTGITLDREGFLGGGFSDPTVGRPNNLAQLMVLGIKEGASTAEAFDTVLPDYYAKFGFKAVSTVAFNDAYKPSVENGALSDWNFETYKAFNNGRPDIVHLIYDGGDRATIEKRLGQFETYKYYESKVVKKYDNEGYDASYSYMLRQALNKFKLYEVNGISKESTSGLELDTNGEPKLSSVLNYLKTQRNKGAKLSNKEISELSNNMTSLSISTFEELYNELRSTFYRNGVFEVTKDNLDNSTLYTELETLDIMSNPVLQNNIKTFVEKIETQYLADDSNKLDDLLKTYFHQEEDLVVDTRRLVGIGKHEALNTYTVSQILADKLAEVTDRLEFENKVKEIPFPSIVSRFQSDVEFADSLYDRFSNTKVIPRMKTDKDGLIRQFDITTKSTLKEVLKADIPTTTITDDLAFLVGVNSDIWEENLDAVKEILKKIELNLIPFNIDVVGLSETAEIKAQEEVLVFVDTLDRFVEDLNTTTVEENTVDNIATEIDKYFERVPKFVNTYEQLQGDNKNRTLVEVSSNLGELELFDKHSLIRTKEGYYHKVKVLEKEEAVYDLVYELVTKTPSLLPKEAYYPTAFDTDDTFNLGKLTNPKNTSNIKRDIKRYITKEIYKHQEVVVSSDLTTLRKMTIYKMMFNHPVATIRNEAYQEELKKADLFNGDYEYLTTDFVADFYNYQLTEKSKNSELYNNVLKHFAITEQGISIETRDTQAIQKIKLMSPSNALFKDLQQYILIAKDSTLNLLKKDNPRRREIKSYPKEVHRKVLSNNSTILPLFKGEYNVSNDELLIKNTSDNFVRINKGVYEKVGTVNNTTVYTALPKYGNNGFSNYSKTVGRPKKIDISKYRSKTISDAGSTVKSTSLYSKKDLENINKKIDECN